MTPTPRPRVVLYNPRAPFYTMPLSLLALASSLDRKALDVRIIDGRLARDSIRSTVDACEGALCLGVTVLTGSPIRDALAVSRAVKAAHPRCTVVWGGWHPSLFPEACLDERAVDAVVVGQGEATFRDLVERLSAGEPMDGCPGTWTRLDGRARAGPIRAFAEMERFAAHDYQLIDVAAYFALKGRRQVDYISSQGCRFRCAFCADPAVYARQWTGLSPARVAAEASRLAERYGMEELAFQDETFFTSPTRVDALAEAFLQQPHRFTWTATLRADQACRLGDRLFEKTVRSGLRRVMVGVESGSPATLQRLRKDVTLDQVHQAAEMCTRHGVGAIFNFIVGFPGESDGSVRETLSLAKRLQRSNPAFETPIFYYRPYPGSLLAAEAAAGGFEFPRALEGWADFDYVGGRGPWVSPRRWREIERFKFYARQAWRPGAWRWPLRTVSRWRCDRDVYSWPLEKFLVEFVHPPRSVS